MENGTILNHEHTRPRHDRTLRQVAEEDFLLTTELLREEYDPYFHPGEIQDFLKALVWLQEDDNLKDFEKARKSDDYSGLPRFLENFQFSINLFFELEKEIKSGKDNNFLDVPVAFSKATKESLRKDLDNATYDRWIEIKGDPVFQNPDALSVQLFRAYWKELRKRAFIIRAGGNHSVN